MRIAFIELLLLIMTTRIIILNVIALMLILQTRQHLNELIKSALPCPASEGRERSIQW
jgi:hypothetical protein